MQTFGKNVFLHFPTSIHIVYSNMTSLQRIFIQIEKQIEWYETE